MSRRRWDPRWWELTWLVAHRELRERARARSFWIATALLLAAVTAGTAIPAVLHGGRSTARVAVVGAAVAALAQVAREAGGVAGATVTVVPLPSVAAAQARLRSGDVDAALIGDSEVLVNSKKSFSSSTPGASLAGALSQLGGLQKLYAELPQGGR